MGSTSQTYRKSLVKKLAQALAKAIGEKKINVSSLSIQIGLSRNQIYKISRGESAPSLDNAEKIAEALGFKFELQKMS